MDQLPTDQASLLALLPRADLYLQDEIQFAFYPLSRVSGAAKDDVDNVWLRLPFDNRKIYGFGLVDWRDGWFDSKVAAGRTANVFCQQVRAAVARSQRRERVALVITDNRKRSHSRWFPAGAQYACRVARATVSRLYSCL